MAFNKYKAIDRLWIPMLWKVRWKRSLQDRWFRKGIAGAPNAVSAHDIEQQWHWESAEYEEFEQLRKSRLIMQKAWKLGVPVPSRHGGNDPNWDETMFTRKWVLSDVGIHSLRAAIRLENKHRWEDRNHVLPWIAAISGTGLLGAIAGALGTYFGLVKC